MSNQITGKTSIYGVLGYPIEHSLSPLIHNYIASYLQHDLVYVPFSTYPTTLERAIQGAWSLGIEGLNVTIPYKEKVIPYLVGVDSFASQMGAVNTLKRTSKGYVGYNTDGVGLLQSLKQHGVEIKGKTLMILGAGGAARAAAMIAAHHGITNLWVINRTLQHADKLIKDVKKFYSIKGQAMSWNQLQNLKEYPTIDICIQTTPIGMYPNIQISPINDIDFFKQIQTVVDLIYNPLETKFLSLAKQSGCQTMNGLEMLVFQGIKAYELWLECQVPSSLQEQVVIKMEQYFKVKDDKVQ